MFENCCESADNKAIARRYFATGVCYIGRMFTSTADVFRTRQGVFDLTSYVSNQGRNAFKRITTSDDADTCLDRLLVHQAGRVLLPSDNRIHGEIQLAAALPDEDFPAFTCATALLLLDRLAGGLSEDDLYWNWDAFSDHYRLADPAIRAALMNGFRTAAGLGRVSLSDMPDPADCLTCRPDEIIDGLRGFEDQRLVNAIEQDVSARDAAEIWIDLSESPLPQSVLNGIRYLYERPQSIAPSDPEAAPLIPWTL